MARDIMYYFNKKTFKRYELGEIQTDFNMSQVIDGTKDSMQVQVYNYNENVVKPNTILLHTSTNTWWIVKKDNVKRYANENGFYYQHNLSLLGAIDLLNSRDLTDCGFNDKTYTIDQFLNRLFKLSTFEFPIEINYGDNLDKDQLVYYIKSYENYTLLSALRDFLGGYNCDIKLSFETITRETDIVIENAIFTIIPKTGNVDLPILDIDIFSDVREIGNIDKESYGTTVISNAQNVVSTLTKTYPQVGGAKVSSNAYSVSPSNAILRLPTPIFKINWVKLIHYVQVRIYADTGNQRLDDIVTLYPYNKPSLENDFETIANRLSAFLGTQFGPTQQEIYNYIKQYEQVFYDKTTKASSTTIKTGWSVEPYWDSNNNRASQHLIAPPNDETFRFRNVHGHMGGLSNQDFNLLIGTKEDHDSVIWEDRCMYYERGESEIHNFKWFGVVGDGASSGCGMVSYKYTDLNSNNRQIVAEHYFDTTRYLKIELRELGSNSFWLYRFDASSTFFQVNYIPMSDIKIKQDNQNNNIDIKLYNQNGKLNDSVALSKIIDSYSKEIQNETITRYMHYTNFAEIPQIGQLVKNENEYFVINNISYDFVANETNNNDNVGYYIECEFTMSKYISTKSLMVNPNSNIRDYGIPQKFNVKRKQTYRDYFELSLSFDDYANVDTPYVALDKYITIGTTNEQKEYDHTAIIKVDYEEPVDQHLEWYYQLNSTAYIMSKSVYELIDFNDNNIIGYDIQNVWTGFTMSKLFSNNWKTTNVPISYVDDSGKFKGITLQMVSKNKINELYENISIDTGNVAMYSSHVFVGETFYYGKYTNNQVSEEPNTFTSQNPSNYLSIDNENTIIKIPLNEISYDNSDVDLDTVVFDSVYSITYTPLIGLPQRGIVGSYSIITENNIKYLRIVDTSGVHYALVYSSFIVNYDVSYNYRIYIYRGGIDIKDYEIKELEYEKDAIEVPVFEYILQLGDTQQVEVGDRILDTQSGMLQMFTCDVRQANTTTQLNASKVFSGIDVSGDSLVNDNYDRQIEIADTSAVDISFENNNTIMRIKVYDNQVALFYGTAEQDFTYQSTQVSATQLPKSYLLGKDIVIYKNVIKSMSYDMEQDEATCDYDNELMFIIHNPQDSNFDGDDLLVNVNYYKLK